VVRMLSWQSGECSLVLAPEIGGVIIGWSFGAAPLLRRPDPDAIMHGNARGLGCFPLVPFSNRIANGRFRWANTEYALDRNFGDHPHTIHGVGWQSAWQVSSASSTSAVLTLHHDASDIQVQRWPFAFSAEQQFTLAPDALSIVLTVQNLHHSPAPAGLGLHPYFPRIGGATLRFRAGQVWMNGADSLPTELIPLPANWDHSRGVQIGTVALDNCFAGWDGQAQISWPSAGLGLSIEADELFRHLIVYTPTGCDFFCVEPVSHMNDAINRMDAVAGHGLRVLAPGEILTGKVTFRVTP
jgi:aldose 1-epimerase